MPPFAAVVTPLRPCRKVHVFYSESPPDDAAPHTFFFRQQYVPGDEALPAFATLAEEVRSAYPRFPHAAPAEDAAQEEATAPEATAPPATDSTPATPPAAAPASAGPSATPRPSATPHMPPPSSGFKPAQATKAAKRKGAGEFVSVEQYEHLAQQLAALQETNSAQGARIEALEAWQISMMRAP